MIKKIFTIVLFVLLCSMLYSQKRENKEIYYQTAFAEIVKGQTEFVLNDRTRVDILTNIYAIEVDFANKWAESIGQSLYYGLKTNKKAAVLLIMEDFSRDNKYLERLQMVSRKHCITIFVINTDLVWKEIE